MNLGLGGYGSDSDGGDASDNELPSPPVQMKPSRSTVSAAIPPSKQKKKVTIGLPTLKPVDDEDDLRDERPPAKKPRLEAGAGRSSLLTMLPAPKQKNPILPPPQRVLGSGSGMGLVFNARPAIQESFAEAEDGQKTPDATPSTSSSTLFRPPSLVKGRSNISLEEGAITAPPRTTQASAAPAVDFFSLGKTSSSSTSSTLAAPSSQSIISSAPVIPKFEPPEPTPTDPYPGYYTLPSGAWAAYDPEYYAKFTKKWQVEYDKHVRALEKGRVKGFEEMDNAAVEEVDAMKEMEKAKLEMQERESRKAVTKGAEGGPAAPNIKLTASKSSGIAKQRHQLATMLHQAYANREQLEEKIAEGRRNRKEAGNKYGF